MAPVLHDRAEACGKVILLGEHSVVYGHPALAAGLARGLALHATPLERRGDPIELSIPAWDLDLRLDAASEHPVARACLEVLAHCDGPVTGWRIAGESRIPARAGLGSSAALCVALARLALGPDAELEHVVEASLAGERVFHGNPSGIDSEVAARGGVLIFQRERGGGRIEPVALAQPLALVILPTGVARQTADLVGRVRQRRDRLPTIIDPVLEGLAALVRRGRQALEQGELDTLAELASVAHSLLGGLGVGHPELDRLCAAALRHGALAAKLTGAGGGGCGFALCESPSHAASVIAGLLRESPALADDLALRPFAVDVDPSP
ncbi:mevalonate kinase [Nannocystaceae bacterium ST9]